MIQCVFVCMSKYPMPFPILWCTRGSPLMPLLAGGYGLPSFCGNMFVVRNTAPINLRCVSDEDEAANI